MQRAAQEPEQALEQSTFVIIRTSPTILARIQDLIEEEQLAGKDGWARPVMINFDDLISAVTLQIAFIFDDLGTAERHDLDLLEDRLKRDLAGLLREYVDRIDGRRR